MADQKVLFLSRDDVDKCLDMPEAIAVMKEAHTACIATTSSNPVFDDRDVKLGAHINGVGSYTPTMQKIPAKMVARARRHSRQTIGHGDHVFQVGRQCRAGSGGRRPGFCPGKRTGNRCRHITLSTLILQNRFPNNLFRHSM